MILNEQQRKELEAASVPLIKWINENCHPHVQVIVDPYSAELVEGVARIVNSTFIKD